MPLQPAINTNIATLINGIWCYDEVAKERLGREVTQAERHLRCDWTNRGTLAEYLLGVGGTGAKQYPDATFLYCKQVEIDGEGTMREGGNGMVAYERALLKCTYRPFEFLAGGTNEVGNDTIDYGVEYKTFPSTTPCMRYGTSGTNYVPGYATPPLKIGIAQVTRTRFNLTSIPKSEFAPLIDHVNDSTFLGFAAESVLFNGVSTVRKFDSTGGSTYDVTYQFQYRSVGWNKHFNPASGVFETVTYIAGGAKQYVTANMSALNIGTT